MTDEVSFEIMDEEPFDDQKFQPCSQCNDQLRKQGHSLITLHKLSDDCPRYQIQSLYYGQQWINNIRPTNLCRNCSKLNDHHQCQIDVIVRNFKQFKSCPKCNIKIEGLQRYSPYTYLSDQWFRCPLCEYHLCRGCFNPMSAHGPDQMIFYCHPCHQKHRSVVGRVWRWYQITSWTDLIISHMIIFLVLYFILVLVLFITQDLVMFKWFYGVWNALYDVIYIPMHIVLYTILIILAGFALTILLVVMIFKLAELISEYVR